MDIAYIISAYKYPDQLIRLIDHLNSNKTYFIVHIDRKTDAKTYRKIVRGVSHYKNVFFLRRHNCHWGDFGHVKATIKGIRELYLKKIPFDFVFLLTGQDYPIKSNKYIEDFLLKNQEKSFIHYEALPSKMWSEEDGGLDRIKYYYIHLFNRRFKVNIKRRFFQEFRLYGGSSYFTLSRSCIDYIKWFVDRNKNFVNYFRYVLVPDELFFQTIILNSPLKSSIINDDIRYIKWNENADSPNILTRDDFEEIVKHPGLFARKFDMKIDGEILDIIDRHILINDNTDKIYKNH